MSQFPILSTKRLNLIPISYKDASDLFSLLSQIDVCIYNNFTPLTDKQQAKNLIQQDLENSYQNQGIRYAIKDQCNTFIGTLGVHQYDKSSCAATIGYELEPSLWRQGYMFEALVCFIDYLFSVDAQFIVNKLIANVIVDNIASIKLLKKIGFQVNQNITSTAAIQLQLSQKLFKGHQS